MIPLRKSFPWKCEWSCVASVCWYPWRAWTSGWSFRVRSLRQMPLLSEEVSQWDCSRWALSLQICPFVATWHQRLARGSRCRGNVCGRTRLSGVPRACQQGVESRFPGTLFVRQVEDVDTDMVRQWACQFSQVSAVIRDHCSSLFPHIGRVRLLLQEHFPFERLMESVASMDQCDREVMSESAGCTPYHLDSSGVTGRDRPRLYWPSWEIYECQAATIPRAVTVTVTSEQVIRWLHQWVDEARVLPSVLSRRSGASLSTIPFRPWVFPYSSGLTLFWFKKWGTMDRLLLYGRWQDARTARTYVNDGLAAIASMRIPRTGPNRRFRQIFLNS